MKNYYLIRPGETTPTGPMTLEDIKAGIMQGTISMDCMCCQEGGAQWLPVSTVVGVPTPPLPQFGGMPMPGPTMPGGMIKPGNQLVFSILVLLFCCLPTGIYSIIKSTSVDSLWSQGHYAEAQAAAAEAKKWNIIGACVGFGGTALYILLMIAASV